MPMKDYARHFPVVEVQSTFYEPPRDAVMMKWPVGGTPPLEYTMKVNQTDNLLFLSKVVLRLSSSFRRNEMYIDFLCPTHLLA